MKIPEEGAETNEQLTKKVLSVLNELGVGLAKEEILAIHRIPSKNQTVKPVILKTVNNGVKSRVMRKRQEMKAAGYRLADDVTRLNSELINRLNNNDQIHSSWFFNGNVFARTNSGKKIKFELFDNINRVLSDNL